MLNDFPRDIIKILKRLNKIRPSNFAYNDDFIAFQCHSSDLQNVYCSVFIMKYKDGPQPAK